MSDTSQGPGWWQASDGKWYPPEQAPGYQPGPGDMVPGGAPGTVDVGAALTWAWAKFQANLQPLLILGAIVGGIPFLLAILSSFAGSFFISNGLYFVSVIAGLVLTILTIQAGWEIASTGQLNTAEMYKLKGNVGGYVIAAIIFGFMSFLGCLLFCVGFVFVWLIFGFWQFACVGEGQGSIGALVRSKDITMGLGLGNIFVPMLVYMAVGGGTTVLGFGSRYGAFIGIFTLPFSALYGSYAFKTLTGQPIAP